MSTAENYMNRLKLHQSLKIRQPLKTASTAEKLPIAKNGSDCRKVHQTLKNASTVKRVWISAVVSFLAVEVLFDFNYSVVQILTCYDLPRQNN